jgi:hypothetical protein
MASHVFYSTTKKFTTPFNAYIEGGLLLPLKNYFTWVLYGNGQWYLFDLVKSQIVNCGKIDGDINKYSHIIKSPYPLGEREIVFANLGLTRLQVLNPYENKYDENWYLDTPTYECVPANDRSNEAKMTDATNDINIIVLENSRNVVLCERRETTTGDYLVTVVSRDKKEKLQAVHSSNQKSFLLGKVNEKDKILLYADYSQGSLDFAIWDLNNASQGFVSYTIGKNINSTILAGEGWDKDTICLFGNADASGIPEMYLADYQKKDVTTQYFDYLGEDALLTEVVFVNPRKKKVLCVEQGEEAILALYDAKYKRLDFKMNYENANNTFEVSLDKKYFVEYDGAMAGDVDENTPGTTEIKVYSLVNKKMFLLYLMKKAVIDTQEGKKSLLGYYGHPYVAQQIADMFSA